VHLDPAVRRATPRKRDREGAFEFEPHHCFACGELNEDGLRLELHTDPTGSWVETTLEARFQGWDGVAHGGIVSTLLDEVMAWSVIGRGTWGMTARMAVQFKRPVPTDRPIRAEGHVTDEDRRVFRTEGRIFDSATGDVLATAEGTFLAVPPAELERLKSRYRWRRLDADAADEPDTTDAGDVRRPAGASL
jgi:uncharacterized protein (TIGR00369 family)